MAKSGTKNFHSISQGVKEIENNDSLSCISTTTDDFISCLEDYKNTLLNDDINIDTDILDAKLGKQIDKFQNDTLKYEKSLNKSLKSLSNKIDKSNDWELDLIYQHQNINDDFHLMIRAIVMDLLYQGKFDEVDILSKSSNSNNKINMNELDILIKHFQELRIMIKNLYEENYTPLFQWICDNENDILKLSEIKSDLTSLIYYQSLELKEDKSIPIPTNGNLILDIQNNNDSRLLLRIKDYAESLQPFTDDTIYCYSLPKIDTFDKEHVKDIVNSELIRLFNILSKNVTNLQKESPLYNCLLAGHFALGTLLKTNTSSRRKSSLALVSSGLTSGSIENNINNNNSNNNSSTRRSTSASLSVNELHPLINRLRGLHTHLNETDENSSTSTTPTSTSTSVFDSVLDNTEELPIEIELPKWMTYHTIFICPVSIEQTTNTNRPHVLSCHHFVSNRTLNTLSKSMNDEIKCPYCPKRGSWREAHEVKFIAI